MVEIARALSHDARVVIMDEPTAALSRHEIDELFRLVAALKAEGRAILFISHKFDEIFGVCDRWVCLRDGRKVGEGDTADTTEAELVRLMVGRPVEQVFPKRDIALGDVVLEVEGLSNATEFADLDFDAAPRRDPRLLRPGRRRPVRGDAVPVRPHPTHARPRDAGGPAVRSGGRGRGDRRRHRLRAGGPPGPGRRPAARRARERDAGLARRLRARRLPVARAPSTRRRARLGARLSVRAANWETPVGSCRAATSRRW